MNLTFTYTVDWREWRAPPPRDPFRWKQIIKQVADRYDLTVEQITGPRRSRYISWPRFELMHRLQSELGWSLPAIGRRLGGRDHTTVLHGLNKYRAIEVQESLACLREKRPGEALAAE